MLRDYIILRSNCFSRQPLNMGESLVCTHWIKPSTEIIIFIAYTYNTIDIMGVVHIRRL